MLKFQYQHGYQSFFYSPTDAQMSGLKNNIKIYINLLEPEFYI